MTSRAKTDVQRSLAAEEFVWEGKGLDPSHRYLKPTITSWLSACGVRTILDLGCGNGAFTAELEREGFQPIGFDPSTSGISIARSSYPSIEFVNASVDSTLPERFKHAFDAVVAVEVIEHLLRPRSLLERAKEALRPGGLLIVSTPFHGYLKNLALALTNSFDHHWHPLRDFGHVKFFSRKTLTDLFAEAGFDVTGFRGVGRIPALAKSMIVRGELRPETERSVANPDTIGAQPVMEAVSA